MHSRKGALIGALIGAFIMAVISVFSNYYIVYPAFVVIYGMPMDAILGMYKALLPAADNLFKALVIFNLPFNLIKGIFDAAICFIIYKKICNLRGDLNSNNIPNGINFKTKGRLQWE